jgi:ABC-type transport system involved in multi-copper enzyme maturation permease subunit
MFGTLFAFELRSHFRRPATWLYLAIMFTLAFFSVSSDAVVVGIALGKVKKNSPYTLAQVYVITLAIGQIITSALVGTTVLRDYDARVHELLFTTRLTRSAYLGAKYLAAFLAMLLVFAALPVGAMLGTVMPWVDAETVQAIQPWHYIQPYLVIGVPGIFFLSAMLFAVGSLTRSAFSVYVAGILLLVGYSVGGNLVRTLDRDMLANLIDPFGFQPLDLMTRYWTTAEKNARVVPMEGFMLANRALWAGIGALLLAAAFRLVKLEKDVTVGRKKRGAAPTAVTAGDNAIQQPTAGIVWQRPMPALGSIVAPGASAWFDIARFHGLSMLRSVPFLAIATIGFINVVMNAWFADQSGINRSWPMSWLMAESITGGAALFMIVLLTFYSGELVWRERQVRLDQVVDASPVATSALLIGKFMAMLGLLLAFATASMLAGMVVQLLKGYPAIDVRVYALYIFLVDYPSWAILTAVGFLIQSLVPRKAIGHVFMILVYVSMIAVANLGYDHQLLQIGATGSLRWSDLNGAGNAFSAIFTLHGYSLSLALVALGFTYVAWSRGTAMPAFGTRLRERFRGRVRLTTLGGLVGASLCGGFFFYNANILNPYRTRTAIEKLRVAYEQRWRRYETLATPKIVATSLTVDLEPSARRARTATRYTLVNRTTGPIDTVLVNVASDAAGLRVMLDTLAFDRPITTLSVDTVFGVHLVRLDRPLGPGDTARLTVVQRAVVNGFPNGSPDRSIVENGTFLNREAFPTLGYSQGSELGSDELRRKYKLPPARRSKPREDSVALQRQSFFGDADFVTFDATVSTDLDQIAMAPGYLEKEWTANGRRYFRYVMDSPIPNFFSVLSARWTVTRDSLGSVPIEVYHHPTHTFNVARMVEASKAALAFYTKEFGPYQHKQLRILEFPRYAGFAQSFPNTVPYSEGIGFVARVDSTDVEDTDLPYFVTAHEIAHQWFPYQRMPADVEGSQMLSESLSEYAALVITDRLHGRPFTQKFLRAELDRYLRGRSTEIRGERPLTRVDAESYVWYQKGSLAFFALRDLIGEQPLHAAIRTYLDEGRFTGPPYATTKDLMRHLTAATPDSLRYALTDYFETITLWDVRTDSVSSRKRSDGQFDVTVYATSKKFRADSLGAETETPMADYVDVGVFGEAPRGSRLGTPLAVRRVKVGSGSSRFSFVVPKAPSRAGIDPYTLLIDRNPGDNTKEIR